MWTCRLKVSLLVVCLPLVFCAPADAQYLNVPNVVATGGGPLWWSDAAYNPARNEYGMTWQNGYIIRWRRLDSTGAVLGSEFALGDGVTQGHHWSAISYNSVQQEYLIVYSGWIDGVGDHMRALRVNATTGAQIGGTIWFDTIGANSTTGGIDLAYSSTSNSYMTVYESYTEGKIYSRRLDAFGNPVGSRVQVNAAAQLYSRNCQLAWNSVNNEYLVTYMGSPTGNGFDYFAQRVSASNGALLGSSLALTGSNGVYNFGGVAYDSNANRYLVVYDGGASPPYGQLVSNTATLVGSAFAIGSGIMTGWAASAAYDSSKHEFLVSWSANQTASNYSRRVSQAGVCIGNPTDNTGTWGTSGIGNWPPRPVYNSVNDEFLIHWHNSYAYILDRRYKSTVTQTSVSINLGNTNIEDLMTSPIGGDGDTVGATGIGGRECRRNMDPSFNDYYFYFTVNDGWAFQGNKQDVWIYVDYYDNATTGSITLQYDAVSNAYKDGGTVWLTGTNTWKTQKWHVTDAYFGNRENNASDFRIYVGNVVRYLDQSTVNQNTPSTTPPGQASAPSPASGATGVSTTPTLTWTAGANTTTHNVFFGTSNPPPFAVGQATTSYAPGALAAGTTYYWRIDEYRTGGGTTNGIVWSFTTTGGLPGLATNPNPANGATGVSNTPSLSWTAGSGATSHDVRFGTTNPPPFIQNQAGTTYNPGSLIGNTTYFWRIDEKNASGTTTGTVWSFTTTFCYSDLFAYANGNLNGNGSWTGNATSQIQIASQTVKINGGSGGFDANRTISCTGSGGIIQVNVKVQAGTGVDTMWSLWFNDPSGVNICRWYGSGTTARGRIGSTGLVTASQTLTGGWDNLRVRINTALKTAEFFFNGASIGTLDYTGQGAANTLGKLRFERINNSTTSGHFLNFDDLVTY